MAYVLDGILLLIVLISALISRKYGFVRSAIELCGFILAVYLAFSLPDVLAQKTYDGVIKGPVTAKISSCLGDMDDVITTGIEQSRVDEVWDKIPGIFKSSDRKYGISKDILTDKLNENIGKTVAEISDSIAENAVRPVAVNTLKIIYSILIFILVLIITKLIAIPINKLFSISVVGKVNKTLGTLLGIAKGGIYSLAFCWIIAIIVTVLKKDFLIFTEENINNSILFNALYSIYPFK